MVGDLSNRPASPMWIVKCPLATLKVMHSFKKIYIENINYMLKRQSVLKLHMLA